ncbi:MAG: amidohydrolase family protein [Nocardioides alkalitolerans]
MTTQEPGTAREYVVTGGHVLTMDAALGDLPGGDVHVRDGVIVAVGNDLEAPGAERIDVRGQVVVPGFVDTHWHMWNTLWRGLSHDAVGYFGLHRLARAFTPEDHHVAVRHAATEAINAGFTTVHDWANGLSGPADTEAELAALAETGIRGRLGHGDGPPGQGHALTAEELGAAVARADELGEGRLSVGAVVHHAPGFARSVAAARELGLRTIAPHADFSPHLDLLGPDVVYTHGAGDPPQLLGLLGARGVGIALCPATDPLIGAGMPPLPEMLAAGIALDRIGISVDVTAQSAADPFAAMRSLLGVNRVAQRPGMSFVDVVAQDMAGGPSTPLMHPREALAIATVNGARVLGLDDTAGSLTPGKRADLVTVRTDDLNMLPLHEETDPAALLVLCGQPSNVDTVVVDGRVLKRAGRLVGVDVPDLVRRTAAARTALLARAG